MLRNFFISNNMKILVTSSTGLTGRAVVRSLHKHGAYVRAMVHSESRIEEMLKTGADETIIASIENEDSLISAMSGMDTIFYICPTAHPLESEIGCMAIDIAAKLGIKRFIYQSVLNSIEPELPHHRHKLKVEQHLLESHLDYSILRPAAFMQNILQSSELLFKQHIFTQRFFIHPGSNNRINLIDVNDYAEIAAKITLCNSYCFGNFDLCGPQNLSASDMLTDMTDVTGHNIELKYISDQEFIATANDRNVPENTLNTLLAMFHAYNIYGFKGNPTISTMLLGHKPKDFKQFLSETYDSQKA